MVVYMLKLLCFFAISTEAIYGFVFSKIIIQCNDENIMLHIFLVALVLLFLLIS